MSLKDRLAKKTGDLLQSPAQASAPPVAEVLSAPGKSPTIEPRSPRTGPGQMMAFRSHMQENSQRVNELESRLKDFDGSLPVKKLDPAKVHPSKWANRHSSSFATPEFAALRQDIESAGGNVQPIKVRPKAGAAGEYEIIFGHRRHQACLVAGLDVNAIIEDQADKDLFVSMDRENRDRADLSPFEQGEMYRRALDEGLFPSLRALAAEVGADPGNISKAMSIARLPPSVVKAFPSPNDIQYRWGTQLQAALQKEPDVVIKRAKDIDQGVTPMSAVEVFELLMNQAKKVKAVTHDLIKGGKSVGKLKRGEDGSVQLAVKGGAIDDARFAKLQKLVDELLGGKG
jgi:ParB family chromosome partitioning protein